MDIMADIACIATGGFAVNMTADIACIATGGFVLNMTSDIACIATGGTVVSVLDDIIARGADPSQIVVVCIVAAPPALKKLSEKYLGKHSGPSQCCVSIRSHVLMQICAPCCLICPSNRVVLSKPMGERLMQVSECFASCEVAVYVCLCMVCAVLCVCVLVSNLFGQCRPTFLVSAVQSVWQVLSNLSGECCPICLASAVQCDSVVKASSP